MNTLVANMLAAANVLFMLVVASLQCCMARQNKAAEKSWWWVRAVLSLIAMYWAGLYIFVLLADPANFNSALFGQVFVRPANTLTFGIMAASTLQSWRNR